MTGILRTAISLAAGVLTLLLVPELAAPVSAAGPAETYLLEQFMRPAGHAGGHDLDSSDGLLYAQITRRYGTIHSRPATNPATPPAPLALSVAPTYPSEGLRASGNMPGIQMRG
ncbi:MAG: hypothetical protein LAP39_28220 [Acidobacteriia bacterium]|nr:hypothetical protein [Terriglobia bacterium]